MGVGFGGLSIARSAMAANERALQASSHNITNVDTLGYSRQQVTMKTSPYIDINGGQWQYGIGVDVEQTRQIRNEFLDDIYRKQNTALGYWAKREQTFKDIETITGESAGNGLQEVSNGFWDAWQELSKDPSSLTTRSLVVQKGQEFAGYLNHLGEQIYHIQNQLDNELTVCVNDINTITQQIAKLNFEVLKVEGFGDKANDFRDQRNLLIDKICGYANVDVVEQPDGQLDISIGGYFLVTKNKSYELSSENTMKSGVFHSVMIDYAGNKVEVPVKDGKLKSIIDSRGNVYGAQQSLGNGYPNSRADIAFVVDVSDTSAGYLDKMKQSITSYVDELNRRGIDYNLRLVTYSGVANVTSNNYGSDANSFVKAVRALTTDAAEGLNNFETVTDSIVDDNEYRPDVNRYAMVFSAESPSGDENTADFVNIKDKLVNAGITTLVATLPSYYSAGLPGGENGWSEITDATNGSLFDIGTADYRELFKGISDFVNEDINIKISNVQFGTDVIPNVLKKMNAFANILMREVNYVHTSGNTYGAGSNQAEAFFVPINSVNPLKIGNITINPNILNNPNNVATAILGDAGDNFIAESISKIRNDKIFKDDKGTTNAVDYYQTFIMDLGTSSSVAKTNADSQRYLVEAAETSRQQIMGVSMDEEMSSVLRYKYAYSAASRALNVVDGMLDNIINQMGR